MLAASTYQLDVIRTARRLGYTVLTTDNQPQNPGHALADRAFSVDTTDAQGVLELARRERVDGVLAACTDVAVPTAARVAAELGLVGPPVAAADVLCSKLGFRRFLAEQGLPVPRHHALPALPAVPPLPEAELFGGGQRWIIKPDRSSGSKGISIVGSADELAARLPEAVAFSANRAAILERFLDGRQGTCEGVVAGGQVRFHVVLDRDTAAPPHVATIGQRAPGELPAPLARRLVELLDAVFAALEVTDATFDCDFVCAGGEVYLIEVTPRLGGNSISALVRSAFPGFDLVEYAVRLACRDPLPELPRQPARPTAVRILHVAQSGVLRYDAAAAAALRDEPWLARLEIEAAPGDAVSAFVNGRHRLGEAIVVADDRAELERHLAELERRLELRVW